MNEPSSTTNKRHRTVVEGGCNHVMKIDTNKPSMISAPPRKAVSSSSLLQTTTATPIIPSSTSTTTKDNETTRLLSVNLSHPIEIPTHDIPIDLLLGVDHDLANNNNNNNDVAVKSNKNHNNTMTIPTHNQQPQEQQQQQSLKDWIWERYQNEILSSLTIKMVGAGENDNHDENDSGDGKKLLAATNAPSTDDRSFAASPTLLPSSSTPAKPLAVPPYAAATTTTTTTTTSVVLPTEEELLEQQHDDDDTDDEGDCAAITKQKVKGQERRLRLLDSISSIQRQYLQMEEPRVVFGNLLESLLQLTDSEYGFIGEVKIDPETKTKYLQTHAITNIAWNSTTRAFYENNVESGLKFTNLNSLFGHVIVEESPVISNDPASHPSACGIPEGHPPLNYFLGIPFFEGNESTTTGGNTIIVNGSSGNSLKPTTHTRMSGMVGIANKPGGYSQADIDFIEPFTVTCSNLIRAYAAIRENKYLINTLEEKVAARTKALEQANKRVVEASQAQLQHFACMSHEIRTPLNCIMGLSSLLQDTQLNPHQADSLQMIVTSGDLLLTVVNDVLDYSKLASGNVEICFRQSNLQGALDTVVHSITQKAKTKSLQVKTFYGVDVPEEFTTDSRRLQQILYNLLGNAVKFSNEQGTIEFQVSVVHSAPAAATNSSAATGSRSLENNQSPKRNQQPKRKRRCLMEDDGGEKTSKDEASCPHHTTYSSKDGEGKKNDGAMDRCPFHPARAAKSSPPHKLETADIFSEDDEDDHLEEEGDGASPLHPHSPINNTTTNGVYVQPLSNKVLRFTVKDYGTGIDKKDFQRIFKPFKQANSFTEQLYGGTGLGLAITSKLVRGLGGRISVDSVKGEWSEFTVDLPFLQQYHTGTGHCTTTASKDGAAVDDKARAEMLSETCPTNVALYPRDVTILSVSNDEDARNVEKAVLESCSIPYLKFSSMFDMLNGVSKSNKSGGCAGDATSSFDKNRFYICLVQEDLFEKRPYQRLSKLCHCALMTYGPQYGVKETNRHFRSLSQVLPSVLMKYFQEARKENITTNTIEKVKNPAHPRRDSSIDDSGSSVDIASSASSTASSNHTTQPISRDKMRVLIAEDNPINQKVLQRMLSRLGVKYIDIVENGKLAVELDANKESDDDQYHVIYMDMQMPVMDGLEACRQITQRKKAKSSHYFSSTGIRNDPNSAFPKIIFVTANVTDGHENDARAAGGDGFISKPFRIDEIERSFGLL